MDNEFLTYEPSLEMEKLGFDEPCFKAFTEEYKTLINLIHPKTNTQIKTELPTKPFTAPLYQQAFRWLSVNHGFRYKLEPSIGNTVDIFIWHIVGWMYFKNVPEEGAEIVCLDKMIELAKKQKEKYATHKN